MTITLDYGQVLVNPPAGSNVRGDELVDLRRLYDEHGADVYRFCSRTLPAHLAEETTQDVFVRAWKYRDRYDPSRASVIAWLIGIAKNRVIDIARAEQRHSSRRADLGGDADSPAAGFGETDHIERVSDRVVVAQALRCLPERQRRAVYMSYVEGKTHQEIADQTGEPLGTVKSDVRRGIAAIRERMEENHGEQ